MSKIFKAVFLKITFLEIDQYNSKRLKKAASCHDISSLLKVMHMILWTDVSSAVDYRSYRKTLAAATDR